MKQVEKEVRHKGEVIGTIKVPVYESLEEAEKALGTEKALSHINRQEAQDKTNEYRAEKTRQVSPATKLKRLMERDPKIAAQINKLLEQAQD